MENIIMAVPVRFVIISKFSNQACSNDTCRLNVTFFGSTQSAFLVDSYQCRIHTFPNLRLLMTINTMARIAESHEGNGIVASGLLRATIPSPLSWTRNHNRQYNKKLHKIPFYGSHDEDWINESPEQKNSWFLCVKGRWINKTALCFTTKGRGFH